MHAECACRTHLKTGKIIYTGGPHRCEASGLLLGAGASSDSVRAVLLGFSISARREAAEPPCWLWNCAGPGAAGFPADSQGAESGGVQLVP